MTVTSLPRLSLLLITLLLLTACAPAVQTAAAPTAAAPASTAQPAAPADCSAPGMQTYADPRGAFCFAYPEGFTIEGGEDSAPAVLGPVLDPKSPDRLRARFSMRIDPLFAGASLSHLAAEYASSYHDLSGMIRRSQTDVGGVPAEVLDNVPGLLSARVVMLARGDALYTLSFHPSGFPDLAADVENLYRAVTQSFTFLSGAQTVTIPSAAQPLEASWLEFDQPMQFHYDPSLALWMDTWTIPAVTEPSPEQAPQHAIFRFLGYNGGMPAQLPYPLAEARVMVFRAADLPAYGPNLSNGYPTQLELLRGILSTGAGIEPGICGIPQISPASGMPFLPAVNARADFCAHARQLEFIGGRGVRYLTHFSQDAGGVVDWQLFYTFQGLSADGQFYVSAVFPARSGVFPMDLPREMPAADDPQQRLKNQLARLESLPDDAFNPSLTVLDDLVRSLHIGR